MSGKIEISFQQYVDIMMPNQEEKLYLENILKIDVDLGLLLVTCGVTHSMRLFIKSDLQDRLLNDDYSWPKYFIVWEN